MSKQRLDDAASDVLKGGVSRRQGRMRGLGLRLVAVALGLVVAAMAAEAMLRLLDVNPPRVRSKRYLVNRELNRHFHCYDANLHGELEPLPAIDGGDWHLRTTMLPSTDLPLEKLDETPWCVEYQRSSLGLRDHDYAQSPPEGVLRIAVVGDSFAFGEGVPLERTMCYRLNQSLGDGFQVMNVSRPGLDTSQELELAWRIVPSFHVTRVLVVFVANDVGMTDELAQRQTFINDLINIRDEYLAQHEASAWYAGPSRVLELVGSHLSMRRLTRDTIQWYLDLYDPRQNGANLERLGEDFRQFASLPNCRVAFVLFPLMEGLERNYPLAPIHHRVAAMLREADLPVLDLAPAFAGQRTSELWVHPADHHPNGKAHEIAAREILAWLRRDVPWFLKPEAASADDASTPPGR